MPQIGLWPATRQHAQDIVINTPAETLDLHPCSVCGNLFHSPKSGNGRRRSFCSRQCYHKYRETTPSMLRYRTSDKGKTVAKRKRDKYAESEHGRRRYEQHQRWQRLVLSLDPSQRPQPKPNLEPWPTCATPDCHNMPTRRASQQCGTCARETRLRASWRNAGKPCVECGVPLGRYQGKYCSIRCSNRAKRRKDRKRNPDKRKARRKRQKKIQQERRRLEKNELRSRGAFVKQCPVCDATFDSFTNKGRLKTYCTKRCENKAQGHRRRARKRNAFIEVVSVKKLLKWQDGRCYHCNCKIRLDVGAPHPKSLTLDHLIPLVLGGEHSYVNTVASCWNCNCTMKGTKAINEQLKLV